MTAFAWILLLALSTSVELVDEVYRIPASEWRYVELGLKQQTAFVTARYEVRGPSRRVRVALMRAADVERLRNDLPHGVMAATGLAASGNLEYPVRQLGDYAIVVDNRSGEEAEVHLRVRLDFTRGYSPEMTGLSPRRQLAVILISFAVFFGIVTWSARRLLRAVRR